jgi:hypothetical protein
MRVALARPRNWVLSLCLLIILGALAFVIGGNLAPAGFAGALLMFVIAVVQRFRQKSGQDSERRNDGDAEIQQGPGGQRLVFEGER